LAAGSLTVPFLHYCNINMRSAVATSSACGLPIAISGAITLAISGMDVGELPDYSVGYVYLPRIYCHLYYSHYLRTCGSKAST